MRELVRQKFKAAGIHFAASAFVLAIFLGYIYYVLYTPPILWFEGGYEVALLILFVDITLGPLMTLILYRKGKRGLHFDIGLVLVIQIGAFLYGASTLVTQRPAYITHIVEHFEIVPAASLVEESALQDPSLAPGIFTGPRVVFAEPPTGDEGERIMWNAIAGGKDVHFYRQYYRSFTEHLDSVRERAWPLEKVNSKRPLAAAAITERLQDLGRREDTVLLVPVMGFAREGTAILDAQSGDILDYVDAVLW